MGEEPERRQPGPQPPPQEEGTQEDTWAPGLTRVVEQAAEVLGAAYVGLVLWDDPTAEPHLACSWGAPLPSQACFAVARQAMSQARPIALLDKAKAIPIIGSGAAGRWLPLLGAPFGGGKWSPPGTLVVRLPQGSPKKVPPPWPILECMAAWAGALLEATALQKEIQRKEEQVRHLIQATLDAQEAERERLGLEVHDGVTQTLVSAFRYLQTLEGSTAEGNSARPLVLRAAALIRQAIQECREVINSLQPATLRDLGLVATLRQEMAELEAELKWRVDFRADPVRLPKEVETGLYRIIREAIVNARKHSGTPALGVWLTRSGAGVTVEVRDEGCGFDPRAWEAQPWGKGAGLLSMRKRAELLEGSCTIESHPGKGTTVRVEIPVVGWRQE